MTFNTTLAEQVLGVIDARPEEWDQQSWRCETGMCFAGWAAELTEAQWLTERGSRWFTTMVTVPNPDDFPEIEWSSARQVYRHLYSSVFDSKVREAVFRPGMGPDTPSVQVSNWAAYRLGLPQDYGMGPLFSASNDREDLGRIVKHYTEENSE